MKFIKNRKNQVGAVQLTRANCLNTLGCGLLCCLVAVASANAATNEFWLGPNHVPLLQSLGTIDHPFDGSTASNFDSQIRLLPVGGVLHILPGFYQTLGTVDCALQSGQKVMGAGIDATIIQLSPTVPSHTGVFTSSGQNATQIEVSDLTVDCNYSPSRGNISLGGVDLTGDHLVIRRVKVINAAGLAPLSQGNPESFTLAIFPGTQNSSGNLVEECEVSRFHGGAISAINIGGSPDFWISGEVRNNRVYLGDVALTNATDAINGSWVRNFVVDGNYVEGGSSGFYSDTGHFTNLVVSHNTFKNVEHGCFVRFNNRDNMTFSYNTIELTNNPTDIAGIPSGFRFQGATNVSVIGNTVMFANGDTPGVNGDSVQAFQVQGLIVSDNHFDRNLNPSIDSTCTNFIYQNNFNLDGSAVPTTLTLTSATAANLTNSGTLIAYGPLSITHGAAPGDVLVTDANGKGTWEAVNQQVFINANVGAGNIPPYYNEQQINAPLSLTPLAAKVEHLAAVGGDQPVRLPQLFVPIVWWQTNLVAGNRQIMIENAGSVNALLVEDANGVLLTKLPPHWSTLCVAQSSSWALQTFSRNMPFTISASGVVSTNVGAYPLLTVPPGLTFITTGMRVETTSVSGHATAGAQVSLGSSTATASVISRTRLSAAATSHSIFSLSPSGNVAALTAGQQLTFSVNLPALGSKGQFQTLTADVTGYFR